jgi:hypothetical protein
VVALRLGGIAPGGATEGGDSGLTEKEQVAQGRWKSAKVLSRYVKTTKKQVIAGTKKWRAQRLSGEAPMTNEKPHIY